MNIFYLGGVKRDSGTGGKVRYEQHAEVAVTVSGDVLSVKLDVSLFVCVLQAVPKPPPGNP